MHGTADGDIQRAHLPVADESFPVARVVRVECPVAVERLQRVTDRLPHDPGPELLVVELPVGAPDAGQQGGGCHDALVSPGEELRRSALLLSSLARHPPGYGAGRSRAHSRCCPEGMAAE